MSQILWRSENTITYLPVRIVDTLENGNYVVIIDHPEFYDEHAALANELFIVELLPINS